MGAPGYFVAAGLFMIAGAILMGPALAAHGDTQSLLAVPVVVSGIYVVWLTIRGLAAEARERKKDGP